MAHEFVILRQGKLETYTSYEEIPKDFEHIVKFVPELPPPPHTHEQHLELDSWNEKLRKLIAKENRRI